MTADCSRWCTFICCEKKPCCQRRTFLGLLP